MSEGDGFVERLSLEEARAEVLRLDGTAGPGEGMMTVSRETSEGAR